MTTSTDAKAEKPPPVRIGIPIVLLLLLLAGLTGGLLVFAVQGQDRVAREASETIAGAAFNSEREALEQLVRDYSWWNASVENLIFELNPAWIPDNLDWIVANLGPAAYSCSVRAGSPPTPPWTRNPSRSRTRHGVIRCSKN